MKDAEPRVIADVKSLIDSLSAHSWLSEEGLRPEQTHSKINEQEGISNLAKIVYPVYRYLLEQDFYRIWTVNKIVDESLENGFYNYDKKTVKFSSAIGLLVYKLKELGVVEPIDDSFVDPEDFEFCFVDDDTSRARAYDYCAELALMSGLSDDIVQGHRDDSLFYKRRQEFLG